MGFNYSKKTLNNFFNPKNFGKIKNPDAKGKVGNPSCGDIMELEIRVDKKTNKIKEIKFQTFGCAAAIASTSMLTQIAKGKTLEEAEKITMKEIKDNLGDLPKIKIHCSSMAIEALKKAINNYKQNSRKNGK
jgi:NifU-like protein involved in Fe-S cluster formation